MMAVDDGRSGREWVVLVVGGTLLNTTGIATLPMGRWYSYALIVLGLGMLLGAVLLTLSRRDGGPGAGRSGGRKR